ncbi:MAG: hypothetical protein QM817_07115 [Archangium sp.]
MRVLRASLLCVVTALGCGTPSTGADAGAGGGAATGGGAAIGGGVATGGGGATGGGATGGGAAGGGGGSGGGGADVDAGDVDAGNGDAGGVDAGDSDAGSIDAGEVDAGVSDAGVDAGQLDAGFDAGAMCSPATCPPTGVTCVTPVCTGNQCDTANAPRGTACTENGGTRCDGRGTCELCTNLCLQQVVCADGGTTSLTGTVYLPNGIDPVPNALVYIPNGVVQAFTAGVTCLHCNAGVSGTPLVSTLTGATGTFRLDDVPAGSNIPLVVQTGRWRRQITVPTVAACGNTTVATASSRLPRNQSEGDIPRIAIVTGAFDPLECVLRKMGVQDIEFTPANSTGRINLFTGTDNAGQTLSGAGTEAALFASVASLNRYDLIVLPCQGQPLSRPVQTSINLRDYLNAGGRVLAEHFAYGYFYNFSPFSSVANWNTNQPTAFTVDPASATINTSTAAGQTFSAWLVATGASTTAGLVQLKNLRRDFDGVVAPSTLWLSVNEPAFTTTSPLQFSFDTPVGVSAAQQCGRVTFLDHHPGDQITTPATFPSACPTGSSLTAQERVLEFTLLHLGSCL